VILNWVYYGVHQNEIYRVWLGGFSWAGALAGGILVVVIFAFLTRQPIMPLADALLPLLVSLTVAGWLACWLTGCAYGPQVAAWWGVPAWDEWGMLSARFPTQLLGAISSLATLWLLDVNRNRLNVPGQAANLGLLGLSLEFFALTYFRADPMPNYGGLRLDAWGALFFAAFSLVVLALSVKREARKHPDNSNQKKADSRLKKNVG
jgi:prolipoprotein diacylglyceryltransferase